MKKLCPTLWLLTLFAPILVTAQQGNLVHHSLKVHLDPYTSQINVEDTITLPENGPDTALVFRLNSDLELGDSSSRVQFLRAERESRATGINNAGTNSARSNRYSLSLSGLTSNQIVLNYSGSIYDVASQTSAEYAQSFSETTGIIAEQGVYLSKASAWIPEFDDELVSFDLEVEFAANAQSWTAVSQGDRAGKNSWVSNQPMEEIYLVAADFTEYSVQSGGVELLAYLRQPDPNLATKYLDATERYLALYEEMLGYYPFSKFALVENFWETGYGMPSFTLLGEQVIRFPFILESSYPHEILHNWWGNGVYPDYDSGNWSEGLTAYLADHLFQEMNGGGAQYRKEMLSRYKNYVAQGADFPLNEFTSRNSAATQAVGYGKTLMLWHMLRQEIGDEQFLEGLRQLFQEYKFRRTSFSDIEQIFTRVSRRNLASFFEQWVDRVGAPVLHLSVDEATDNQARIMFAQSQEGPAYALKVPVAFYYAGETQAEIVEIDLSQKSQGFMVQDFDKLQAVVVDPYFDVFRQIHREESPPTLGQLFGASEISFVLPIEDREHWLRLAEEFGQGVDADILYAEDINALPADRSVWILGRSNPFGVAMQNQVSTYGVDYAETGVAMAASEIAYANRGTVLTARHPGNPELALGWIHVDDMVAMPGMIEKLPHYGRYSYLSFIGAEPTNDVKGNWTNPFSPMQWTKPGLSASLSTAVLPARPALAELPSKYLPERLLQHVNQLSANEMQGRGLGTEGIDKAANYIAEQFADMGLQAIEGSYLQQWSADVPGLGATTLTNVIALLPGTNPELADRPVILGAHYDHLGIDPAGNSLYPGADDNASGISIMLEVGAKLSRAFSPQRPVLFVAFTGEESGLLGSQYFVDNPPAIYPQDKLFAMLNLDSVGRLEGRTLQVFATQSAYEWPFMAQGIGFTIGVESDLPAQTIASSDHVSFLNAGIPALHLFSGTHADYHSPTDSSDKLDLAGMSAISLWVEEALVYLADRTEPLQVNLSGAPVQVSTGSATGARAASLGTIPDFNYSGEGVGISGVSPGSAAEAAGLTAEDVLIRYNDVEVSDLQTYSNLLRESSPGDVVELLVLRGDELLRVQVTLKAR